MASSFRPVVNGCYLDRNSTMFKVKMLGYYGKEIKEVIVEDTSGNIKSLDIENWQSLRLIPCCYSSSEGLPISPIR